jgi:hypothetical protein
MPWDGGLAADESVWEGEVRLRHLDLLPYP